MQTTYVLFWLFVLGTMETCVFCQLPLESSESSDNTVKLRDKGSETINRISQEKKLNVSTVPGQKVHKVCRRDFINPKCATWKSSKVDAPEDQSITGLRSNSNTFKFNEHCLFCGQLAKRNSKKKGNEVVCVRTLEFQDSIIKVCKERTDKWGEEVFTRIQLACSDLHAADSVYHVQCNSNFRTGKQVPQAFISSSSLTPSNSKKRKAFSPIGRPRNDKAEHVFQKILVRIDNTKEQISISDIVHEMEDSCGEDAYHPVHIKRRILQHFGDTVILSEEEGRSNILTFRESASSILQNFYERTGKENKEDEKKSIILTAARFIKEDIKSLPKKSDFYPSAEEIGSQKFNDEYLPEALQIFLACLFSEKHSSKKIAAIGQAIAQATRPRGVIAPLQIGLGVQLHHHFASRFLIDTLNNLGFCSSYTEVQKFEMNAAASRVTIHSDPDSMERSFIQFIADNVDHNIRTLDGYGTFHGMGIIAAVTPGVKSTRVIPRKDPSMQEIVELAKIDLKYYKEQPSQLSKFKYEALRETPIIDDTWQIDLLSKVCWPVKFNQSWSAIMHKAMKGSYPGKSTIVFLPMIDMNPSDESCIYSTLHFVCKEARYNNCTPILTFDQPLYWKAFKIIANEPVQSPLKALILRLGGFHTQMSFAGSIGHIMSGTGLASLLETVYAPTAVTHMLSGKAIARAMRGHLLVDTALTSVIISQLYGISVSGGNFDDIDVSITPNDIPEELAKASKVLASLYADDIDAESVNDRDVIAVIKQKMDDFRKSKSSSRTARLWFQYMDMVMILRTFVKAERMGDWNLHLQTVRDMLPYLAASGHNLYVKSLHMYLTQMNELRKTNPDVVELFESGYHVIRRSEKYWSGISSDLAIEQSLMRTLKSTGGMTRGRGMNENQRSLWILSMPDCAEINNAMQSITDVAYSTSYQHKEEGESRTKRDIKDTLTFASFIEERNPFIDQDSLRNIETGILADNDVNVDHAKEVGNSILESMIGKSVEDYSFKRKSQVTTLREKPLNNSMCDLNPIDPQLLFQRFIVAADSLYEEKSDIFAYELSNQPSSMFDSTGFMRSTQKAALAEAIWKLGDCSGSIQDDIAYSYVVDGGSLLHKFQWPSGVKFGQICQRYVDHLSALQAETVVVFDGYGNGPSTKDTAHMRRTKGVIGNKVLFDENTTFKSKMGTFLAHYENKENFIRMLSSKLENCGIVTKHATADADVMIAKTAVSSAVLKPTILFAEDTDLLVLLLTHIEPGSENLIFKSDHVDKKNRKLKVWDIDKARNLIGNDVSKLLPVIHAISGCDTTSRLFGVSKAAALKKITENKALWQQAETFLKQSSQEEVAKAGEQIVSYLYGGSPTERLDDLRYRKFASRILTQKTMLHVNTLPPTSAAASQHSLRSYLQVQEWISNNNLNPCDWGWFFRTGTLMPVKCNKSPAPEKLLAIIKCNCKTNCDTNRCTCRKHGLECNIACGECKGCGCSNSRCMEMEDDTQQLEYE